MAAIEVRLSAVGDRVAVEVTDEGPGLPATLPTLVARARGGRGSRGRGLAIASEIAARHGGLRGDRPGGLGGADRARAARCGVRSARAEAPGR